jgi:hypothetical protein
MMLVVIAVLAAIVVAETAYIIRMSEGVYWMKHCRHIVMDMFIHSRPEKRTL